MDAIHKRESYLNQQKTGLTAFIFSHHSYNIAVSHMMKLVKKYLCRETKTGFFTNLYTEIVKNLQLYLRIANKKTVIFSY